MALHLNLYHEVLNQRRQRKLDPIRFAIAGVVVAVALATGYYFYRVQSVNAVVAHAEKLRVEWETLEPKQQRAKQLQESIAKDRKLAEDLVARIESRFYWGPVLQRLIESVPEQVQLTQLTAEAAPGTSLPLTLTISGASAGPEPRTVAEDMRTTLAAKFSGENQEVESTFRSLEDTDKIAQLQGRSYPTALFSIGVSVKNEDGKVEEKRP